MKKAILLILFSLNLSLISAQKYTTGIGIRAGKFNTGITFKQFTGSDNNSGFQLDGYYTNVASGGYSIKAFYIRQLPFKLPIFQIPIDFIYGAGVHGGYFPYEPQGYYKREQKDANYYDKNVVSVGAGITAQLEYHINRLPVTIGIEAVPFYEFVNPGPEYVDFGIAVRYVFR